MRPLPATLALALLAGCGRPQPEPARNTAGPIPAQEAIGVCGPLPQAIEPFPGGVLDPECGPESVPAPSPRRHLGPCMTSDESVRGQWNYEFTVTRYAYDLCGRQVYYEHGSSRAETRYDTMGRLVYQRGCGASHCGTDLWEYQGSLLARHFVSRPPEGTVDTHYAYDDAGRLVSASSDLSYDGVAEVTAFTLDAAGRPVGALSQRDGQPWGSETWAYDEGGRLLENRQLRADGSLIQRVAWTYDEDGRPLTHEEEIPDIGRRLQERYVAGRLVSAESGWALGKGGSLETLRYCRNGLLRSRTTESWNDQNRLQAEAWFAYQGSDVWTTHTVRYTDREDVTRRTLDADGNVLTETQPSGSVLTYDYACFSTR